MLWKHPSQGNRLLGALAVATAIAVLTLEMSGITPLALMRSYAAVADRCFSFDHFLANSSAWQKAVTISALATTGAIGLFAGSTMIESPCWICVAGFIMGVVGCVQNNSIWQDLSLIVLTVVLMTRDCRWPYLKRLTVAFIICLSIASSLNLFSRYSIRAGGPSAFYEYDGNQYVIQHGFFKDVHCGLLFATFMDEENKVLNDCLYDGTEIPGSWMARLSSSSIWFGPRIGFSWVLHGFPPLTGEPLFWEPGTSFAKADEDRLFDQFMDRHYGTLILLKDCLYLKPEQSKRLLESYSVDQSYKTLTVLKRKPTSPVSH